MERMQRIVRNSRMGHAGLIPSRLRRAGPGLTRSPRGPYPVARGDVVAVEELGDGAGLLALRAGRSGAGRPLAGGDDQAVAEGFEDLAGGPLPFDRLGLCG